MGLWNAVKETLPSWRTRPDEWFGEGEEHHLSNLQAMVVMIWHDDPAIRTDSHSPRLTRVLAAVRQPVTAPALEYHGPDLLAVDPGCHWELKRTSSDGLIPDVYRELQDAFGDWRVGYRIAAILIVFDVRG